MKLQPGYFLQDNTLLKIVPWLVVTCLVLFPVGRTAELPLLLLAIIGIKVFACNLRTKNLQQPAVYFSLFFLCFWLSIILSTPDSYNISKSSRLIFEYLRFFLAGLAVLRYCSSSYNLQFINKACLIIVSFWILDALIQFIFGTDLFGFAEVPQRLNGVFGERKLKFGLFLSVYSTFIFLVLYEKKHLFFSCLVNLLCIMMVLLAGSRGGWIMYGVVLVGYLAYKWKNDLKMLVASMVVLLLCISTCATVLYYNSENFAKKVDISLKIFNGDQESIDQAISLRMAIWKTAVAMIKAHPINGVGARAFRYAYPDYSAKDDMFLSEDFNKSNRKIGALHSHQMQLEVLSETGWLGGILFLTAMGTLFWYWLSRSKEQRVLMLPYALGLAALFFPLNTHYALYSSSWAQVIYWFAPLFFAAGGSKIPLAAPPEGGGQRKVKNKTLAA